MLQGQSASARIFLSRTELESALTPEYLKRIQVIRYGLMAGVVAFYAIILIVYSASTPMTPPATDVVLFLSVAHAMFTLGAIAGSVMVSRKVFSKERLLSTLATMSRQDIVQQALSAYFTSSLIRMAILEGAAFMGAATCLTAVTSGVMSEQPIYWLNSLSAVVLLVTGLATFPTRERIVDLLEDRLCHP